MVSAHTRPLELLTILALSALCSSFQACAKSDQTNTTEYWRQPSGVSIHSVVIEDEDDPACKGFNLSLEQVRGFFRSTMVIDEVTLHNEFDWSRCYMKGAMESPTGAVTWEIYASGIGYIHERNERTVILGCRNCDAILAY